MNNKIRSQQKTIVTCVALILGPIFVLGPAAFGIGIALGSNFDLLSLALLPFCVGGSALMIYTMFQNYEWVELDGEWIRGRRFWTRELVEHPIEDITDIVPLGAAVETGWEGRLTWESLADFRDHIKTLYPQGLVELLGPHSD